MGVSPMNKLSILTMLLVVTACSNKAVYENFRIQQRNECLMGPPSGYEECMEDQSKSYEEYQRELEEVLENDAMESES